MSIKALSGSGLSPASPVGNAYASSLTLSGGIVKNPYTGTGVTITIGTVNGAGPYTSTIALTGTNPAWTSAMVTNTVLQATAGTGSLGTGTVTVTSVVSSTSVNISSTAAMTAGTITNLLIVSYGTATLSAPTNINDSAALNRGLNIMGSVGIGTTNPTSLLQVAGNTTVGQMLEYGVGSSGSLTYSIMQSWSKSASTATTNPNQTCRFTWYNDNSGTIAGRNTLQLWGYPYSSLQPAALAVFDPWFQIWYGDFTENLVNVVSGTTGNLNIGTRYIINNLGTTTQAQWKTISGQTSRDTTTNPFTVAEWFNAATNGSGAPNTTGQVFTQTFTKNMVFNSDIYAFNGGKVGIGTTSPAFGLHIQGNDATGLMIERTANDTTTTNTYTRGLHIRSGTRSLSIGIAGSTYSDTNYQDMVFIESNSKIAFESRNPTTGAKQLVLDTNGNVGIGTTTPSAKLHVVGTVAGGVAPRAFIPANSWTPDASAGATLNLSNGRYYYTFTQNQIIYVYLAIPRNYYLQTDGSGGAINAYVYGSGATFSIAPSYGGVVNDTNWLTAVSQVSGWAGENGPSALTVNASAKAGYSMSIKITCTSAAGGDFYGLSLVFG